MILGLFRPVRLQTVGAFVVLWSLFLSEVRTQIRESGFAFEACIEPKTGNLASAPYTGWVAGVGVGYKLSEYSLWLSALAGPVKRAGREPDVDARDDYGVLRFAARRRFAVDSSLSVTPMVAYRLSTFLIPGGATINGTGVEAGVGVTVALGDLFEVGGEVAYAHDSYHHRSGAVPPTSSFSGSDLALRFLVRFHPAISPHN
jgi:hypothetical protein